MSLGTAEPASETGDDSLSAITFDSDSETKAKRKSFHKSPPTSLKSPYHSKPRKVASWRSLRTAASMPLGGRMSLTPQKLCLGSSKQGYVPGTLIYREKEDMYEEIIELKKLLNMQKSDVDLMRTKLRRLEEENSRKGRQMEQLLDAARGPDFVRTLADKRPDTGWVINGLKQRVLKLEQQCKQKDNVINKLQTDVKTTGLEEMRITMETYYEEIHRLHGLLASSETTGKRPPVEKKVGLKRQKKMGSALLSLSRSVQELMEENQSLKEDLDRVLSSSPTTSQTTGACPGPGAGHAGGGPSSCLATPLGSAAPCHQPTVCQARSWTPGRAMEARAGEGGLAHAGYADWSKPRLVRRIAELEKKLSSMESPKPQASEAVRSTSLTPSASSPTLYLQERERLHGAARSPRGERHALNTQLQERDLQVKQLLQTKAELEKELETMKEGERERREREKVLREELEALSRKFRELEGRKKEEEDEAVVVAPEKEGALLDEAATVLQAAFRGHLARARLLSSRACVSEPPRVPSPPPQDTPKPRIPSPTVQAEGDSWQEEAVTIIQSALRAHLARARYSAPSPGPTTATVPERPAWLPPRAPSSPPRLAAAPAEPPVSGLQPTAPTPPEDVNSDDSDEIVLAPSLPTRKSASPR